MPRTLTDLPVTAGRLPLATAFWPWPATPVTSPNLTSAAPNAGAEKRRGPCQPRNAFIAFAGVNHKCIGANYSMINMGGVAAATVCSRRQLRPAPDGPSGESRLLSPARMPMSLHLC